MSSATYEPEPGFAAALLNKMKISTNTKNISSIISEPNAVDMNCRCKAFTRAGKRCTRADKIDGYCGLHAKNINEEGEYIQKKKTQKRPPSAYLIFKKDAKDKYSEDLKEITTFGERQSYLSKIWRNMSDSDKSEYVEKAAIERETFYKDNPKMKKEKTPKRSRNAYVFFKMSNTFEGTFKEVQVAASKAWKSMSQEDKLPYVKMAEDDKEKFLKSKKDLGPQKPKRPLTAYNCFMKDMDPKIRLEHPDLSFGDLAKKRSVIWSKVKGNDAQMKVYREQAEEDKVRYEKEMKEFLDAGGVMKSKAKKDKSPSKMPKELETEYDEETEESDGMEIEMCEFSTSQKLPSKYALNLLAVDPITKIVYDTSDEEGAEEVGKAEFVTTNEEGEVIEIGTITFD